jgi:hypothetical protein
VKTENAEYLFRKEGIEGHPTGGSRNEVAVGLRVGSKLFRGPIFSGVAGGFLALPGSRISHHFLADSSPAARICYPHTIHNRLF